MDFAVEMQFLKNWVFTSVKIVGQKINLQE